MKAIKKLIAIGGLLITLSSCSESFLDLAPESNANANTFYKTTEDFDVAVNAAYASLHTFYGPEGPVSYSEQLGDNATMYNVAGIQADRWAFKDYTLRPSNTEVYRFWRQCYKALFDINIVLDRIEPAELSADYKTQVKAQMHFLRGLYYYNMVQLWGDLPLVTKPLTTEESYSVLRSPEAEVYQLIVADLQYAAEHLPLVDQVSAPGKASRGAAQTLLGKVYLSLDNKPAATEVLQQVYNSGKYSLVSPYSALWIANNKNTRESIFEIQYKGGPGNPYSLYWTAFTPTENGTLTKYGGGMNMVTDDLYNEYEAADPRRDASIFNGYTNAAGVFVPIRFPRKWVDQGAPMVGSQDAANNNFIVLRYADLLLLLTEATGDPRYMNEVRARAGLPAYGTAAYPAGQYPTLERALEHERRVELAMEFHRWFDLKRTGRAVSVLSAKGKPVTAQKLLLPIPETVIQQNPGITQNEAYR